MTQSRRFLWCVPLLLLLASTTRAVDKEPDMVALTNANLVLSGGGETSTETFTRFMELAGDQKAHIVILSAAMTAPDKKLLEAGGEKAASITVLHTREKAKAEEAEFLKPLQEAEGVWLHDGDPAVFAATYRGTAVEKELRKLIERKGVIGASSAVAALSGKWWIDGTAGNLKIAEGFGWLPNAIVDVHFLKRNRVERLQEALTTKPGFLGIGIDEGTTLVVRNRTALVVGKSYVTFCLAPSTRRPANVQTLGAGGVADLVAMQKAALARSQTPFPADKPATPEVPKGTLIIGGGGGMPNEGWKKFIELAGGPDAVIVVFPTAMEDPLPEEISEVKALKRFGAKNIKVIHTRSRSVADTEEFAAPLRKAGGVWFSGGRQWHFVDSYAGTLTEKLCHEVLERGGVIGGSSAGASIQSEYMPRGHPLGNTVVMAEGYERGLGFLPGVAVDQHFFARKRTADMTAIMKLYPQLLGIGIDEGTIIVVKGSVFEVIGKSKVAVFDRKKPVAPDGKDYEELQPGERYDMKTRKKAT